MQNFINVFFVYSFGDKMGLRIEFSGLTKGYIFINPQERVLERFQIEYENYNPYDDWYNLKIVSFYVTRGGKNYHIMKFVYKYSDGEREVRSDLDIERKFGIEFEAWGHDIKDFVVPDDLLNLSNVYVDVDTLADVLIFNKQTTLEKMEEIKKIVSFREALTKIIQHFMQDYRPSMLYKVNDKTSSAFIPIIRDDILNYLRYVGAVNSIKVEKADLI